MKLDILKDKIIEKGFDYKSLTEPLNLDYQTIMKKMNGKSKITLNEISKLRKILNLTDKEVVKRFIV